MTWWKRQLVVGTVGALALQGVVWAVADPKMNSSNFSIVESDVGGSGDEVGASTGYRFLSGTDGDGGSSLGENAVGNSASTNFQTNSGFNTTAQPSLTLNVGTSAVNLGALSTTVATTATATFNVLNYTSYGYVVQVIGSAPTHNGNALDGMGTQSANSTGCSPSCTSAAGSEQFGINLKANTSPVSVGADPLQQPSSAFSYGAASGGYATANSYRYFNGDTIAASTKSSGRTDYTISFLANISPTTPGGSYTGSLSIVATGTY